MIKNNDKISDFELGNLLFLTILGVGLINLPSGLAQKADNDAWILIILSGCIAIVSALIMCKVGQRHAQLGFVGTLRYLFGGFLGTVLAIPVMLYALVLTAIELRLSAEVTKIYLLHKTPVEFIILPIIIMTVVLVRKGIEPITRAFGVYMFIIAFAMILIFVAGNQNNDYSNLLPIMKTPITRLIPGLTASVFAFTGFELLLIVFPYLKSPGKASKVSLISLSSITILYCITVIYCIAKLGVEETQASIWPLMAFVKTIDMPGGFVENLEGILSALWVFYAFTSLVGFLFFFTVIAQGIFKHRGNKHFTALAIPIVYILSLQGNSVPEVLRLSSTVLNYLATYTMFVLPLLMLILSMIRGKKSE